MGETINGKPSAENIKYTLYDISHAVHTALTIENLYQSVYDSLNRLMPLQNFFVASYDAANKSIRFEFIIDEHDDSFPIIENMEEPNCLTGEVILARRPMLLKENMLLQRAEKNKLMGVVPRIWLGVPLIVQDSVAGVISVQNYSDPDYFSHEYLELLVCVSDLMAMALEKNQLDHMLGKREKTLSLISGNTRSLIAILNSQGMYEFANPAHHLLGYDDNDLAGSSFYDIIHPDDIHGLMHFLEKGITGPDSQVTLDLRIQSMDGEYFMINGSFNLTRTQDGFLENIVLIGELQMPKETGILPFRKAARPVNPLPSDKKPGTQVLNSRDQSCFKRKTILVIEDEDMVRSVAVRALNAFGYATLESGDGETGLRIFTKNHRQIDAVLLDIIMPKMSGTKVFKRMLEIDPSVKVIVTSGHVTNQDQQKVFSNACGYLDKPYQIMDLKKILHAIFNSESDLQP